MPRIDPREIPIAQVVVGVREQSDTRLCAHLTGQLTSPSAAAVCVEIRAQLARRFSENRPKAQPNKLVNVESRHVDQYWVN